MGESVPDVAIIHGGGEPDYLYGLVTGLASFEELRIEVVDSETTADWFGHLPNVRFYNLRGRVDARAAWVRAWRNLLYHLRLCLYIVTTNATIIHIQWETRPYLFERLVLLSLYKLLGKKVIFTAHNVDRYVRDAKRGLLHRWSLHRLYYRVDRVIVHTPVMKAQLCARFSIPEQKVAVVPHGINIRVPLRGISPQDARKALNLSDRCKVILCFGNIAPYKSIELLLEAMNILVASDPSYRLLIAGRPKEDHDYADGLKALVQRLSLQRYCTLRFEFIPYEEVETYFMAADCLALPYHAIFQSGVLFLAYRFGLPAVATDVGNFREDIVEGVTGFISPVSSAHEFARTIERYFESDLFKDLENSRRRISSYASERYGWSRIAEATLQVYRQVLEQER